MVSPYANGRNLARVAGTGVYHAGYERHRVPQQRHSQGCQKTEAVPHGRFRDEGDLPGDSGGVEKMDHADPQLEAGPE